MSNGFIDVDELLFEVRRFENRILAEHWDAFKKRQRLDDRIDLLEEGLGKVALLARSLAELLLKKGFITHKELEAQFSRTDLADGVKDRSLDANDVMPGEGKQKKQPRPKLSKRISDSHPKHDKRP
jgi:hypothetical protein